MRACAGSGGRARVHTHRSRGQNEHACARGQEAGEQACPTATAPCMHATTYTQRARATLAKIIRVHTRGRKHIHACHHRHHCLLAQVGADTCQPRPASAVSESSLQTLSESTVGAWEIHRGCAGQFALAWSQPGTSTCPLQRLCGGPRCTR